MTSYASAKAKPAQWVAERAADPVMWDRMQALPIFDEFEGACRGEGHGLARYRHALPVPFFEIECRCGARFEMRGCPAPTPRVVAERREQEPSAVRGPQRKHFPSASFPCVRGEGRENLTYLEGEPYSEAASLQAAARALLWRLDHGDAIAARRLRSMPNRDVDRGLPVVEIEHPTPPWEPLLDIADPSWPAKQPDHLDIWVVDEYIEGEDDE